MTRANAALSEPRERDDLLPLQQPAPPVRARVRDRLAHGTVLELGEIRQILAKQTKALAALDRADEAGDAAAFILAAHELREAGDVWTLAKRLAKVAQGKLK